VTADANAGNFELANSGLAETAYNPAQKSD